MTGESTAVATTDWHQVLLSVASSGAQVWAALTVFFLLWLLELRKNTDAAVNDLRESWKEDKEKHKRPTVLKLAPLFKKTEDLHTFDIELQTKLRAANNHRAKFEKLLMRIGTTRVLSAYQGRLGCALVWGEETLQARQRVEQIGRDLTLLEKFSAQRVFAFGSVAIGINLISIPVAAWKDAVPIVLPLVALLTIGNVGMLGYVHSQVWPYGHSDKPPITFEP